ncbi:Arb2 domain-containing protein [Phaeosphaeriaceae sp. PMI808]|nr:Arb2 domain-containing protein [Phaeosphaeriaceae sp. PMI808]
MFRRQENTLEPDPVFPADLTALGFFLNQNGQTRMIEAPDKDFNFRATNNDRVNETRREAMHECWRQGIEKRLSLLGIDRIYLPEFTKTKPDRPHIPILSSSPEILKSRKRIIVIINDGTQDLGILAYRMIRELGVNGASIAHFVKEVIRRSAANNNSEDFTTIFDDGYQVKEPNNVPAIVVLNTGQLLYSHKHNKAMTIQSWSAMPRKSAMHEIIKFHEQENRVENHRTATEHVESVFNDILCNPNRISTDAELYVIAIEGGAQNLLDVLEKDFEKYGSRIAALALVQSLVDDSQIKNRSLRAFLHQRTREWRYSDLVTDPGACVKLPEHYSSQVPLSNVEHSKDFRWSEALPQAGILADISNAVRRLNISVSSSTEDKNTEVTSDTDTEWYISQTTICPAFSGGNNPIGECVFTNRTVQDNILTFFFSVAQNPADYCNPSFQIYKEAPQPTPDNPLTLDPDDSNFAVASSLPADMTPEQAEVDLAKEQLLQMELSLKACPSNVSELEKGRKCLISRIANQKDIVSKLEIKALASGGLGAGEAPQQRENWRPQKRGPEVPFAGTMVDSELLRAAGLVETADEELEKLNKGSAQI